MINKSGALAKEGLECLYGRQGIGKETGATPPKSDTPGGARGDGVRTIWPAHKSSVIIVTQRFHIDRGLNMHEDDVSLHESISY